MFNPQLSKDSTVTNLKNAANELGDDLHSVANQAGRKVRSLYNTATDELSHASEAVTAEIRSNPVRATAVALGAGVLLGLLLRK